MISHTERKLMITELIKKQWILLSKTSKTAPHFLPIDFCTHAIILREVVQLIRPLYETKQPKARVSLKCLRANIIIPRYITRLNIFSMS